MFSHQFLNYIKIYPTEDNQFLFHLYVIFIAHIFSISKTKRRTYVRLTLRRNVLEEVFPKQKITDCFGGPQANLIFSFIINSPRVTILDSHSHLLLCSTLLLPSCYLLCLLFYPPPGNPSLKYVFMLSLITTFTAPCVKNIYTSGF